MIKSTLMNGLLKQDKESLATQIAMWDNITIWEVAYQKLKGLLTSENELNKLLEQRKKDVIRKFYNKPDVLQSHLIKLFCKHLDINNGNINSIGDLNDLGLLLEERIIKLQRDFTKNEFDKTTFAELMKYNLEKMFENLSKDFKDKSVEDQSKIVQEIMKVLEEMPDDQKEKLRKELKVDKITDATIAKAITTGALGVAFAAVVEVAGFSAYIFAVKALAAVAGLVGLTLPFAAYSTLTSFLAALANPFLTLPAAIVIGYFMTKKANKKIKNSLLPTLATQIGVAASKDVDILDQAELLIEQLLQKE